LSLGRRGQGDSPLAARALAGMPHLALAVAQPVPATRAGNVEDAIRIRRPAPPDQQVAADDQDGRRESRQRQGQGSEHGIGLFSPTPGPEGKQKTALVVSPPRRRWRGVEKPNPHPSHGCDGGYDPPTNRPPTKSAE